MKKSCVYILTNPSFPEYVKIGYADDVQARLNSLNSDTGIPYSFRLFAYLEVDHRLADFSIHNIIDTCNPSLRSTEIVGGKKREREFFKLTPRQAYSIFESIASIGGCIDRLHLVSATLNEQHQAQDAQDHHFGILTVDSFLQKKSPFSVSLFNDLVTILKSKIAGMIEAATTAYIALRNSDGTNIAEIHFTKTGLSINTRVPKNPKNKIGKKFPDKYLWTLDYCVKITSKDGIFPAANVILDTFEQVS